MTKHQITTVTKGNIPTCIVRILETTGILEASGGEEIRLLKLVLKYLAFSQF